MRILVIGSGGREHALVWKLRQCSEVTEIFTAPGNGGTALEPGVVPVDIPVDDVEALVRFARREKIDLVVPGPELPLTLGIVDAMTVGGVPCFGPDRYCAQLEGSKAFAKEVMLRGNVPTAKSAAFTVYEHARAYVERHGAPIVIKADGLAAGKGVVVARTTEEALAALEDIMRDRAYGEAGSTVVVEECLEGEEASFLCFCDGETALPLPSAQDHKAAYDGDTGPNTGGMGAYSPAPLLPAEDAERMADLVIRPVLRVLAAQGHPFRGVLYAGLMMTADGPKVLEYNVRFGDPECQPLLMRLHSNLVQVMQACLERRLHELHLEISAQTALGVVVAAEGYPGAYRKGMEISGIAAADALPGVKVFHSGTVLREGNVLSAGGRVLCVTALGDTLEEARAQAYAAVEKITMPESRYRRDIGMKGIARLRQR